MYQTLSLWAPQLILALLATTLLLAGLGGDALKRSRMIRWITVGILVVFALIGFILGRPEGFSFRGLLVVSDFTHYANAVIGLSAAFALMFNRPYLEAENLDRFELSILTLYAVLGMSIMVGANNLLSMYIGIEMQSLALYIMAAFNRDSLRASEAGLKYFVLGAISSGLLLYGASMVYGFTGSINFDLITASIAQTGATTGVIAGMVFLLCGLAFKISAAPFHMWTPDVYEGSPTPITGFFAAAPKFAAILLIAKLVMGPFVTITDQWQQVIIVLAVMSMFVGAFGAIVQTNIKRLMAYSSIANMGYALVPLAAGTAAGVKGMLIFMTIYIITMIGLFAAVLQMRIRNGMVEQISDLAGLSKTNRGLALMITIFMFSIMGIPPLLGFWGKLYAFLPAIEAGLWPLVVIALVASVVGAFYYLRIVKTIWFDEPEVEFVAAPTSLRIITTISAVLVFILFALPFLTIPAQNLITEAAAALL